MTIKRNFCMLILAMLILAGQAASEINEFRVSQVRQNLSEVTVYLHIQDYAGNAVQNLGDINLRAFVGGFPVPVNEIEKFDEGVAYIFLVDISKSLSAAQFTQIKSAIVDWIASMAESDHAAIMTFGTTVRLIQDFTTDKEMLSSAVKELNLTDMDTQLHLGLVKAMEMGNRRDEELPGRRVIITLTDGEDDFAGGMTRSEVFNMMKADPVPIYAIGFVRPPMTRQKEVNLTSIGEFARTSGGIYVQAGTRPFADIYAEVRRRVRDIWVAQLDCSQCLTDGNIYRLEMYLTVGAMTMSGGQDIRLLPILSIDEVVPEPLPEEEPAPEPEKTIEELEVAPIPLPVSATEKKAEPFLIYAGSAALVLILLILLLLLRRKKKGIDDIPAQQRGEIVSQKSMPISPTEILEKADVVIDHFPEDSMEITLTVVGGTQHHAWTRKISKELVIGRLSDCDLSLKDDEEISGRHCKLSLQNKKIYIQDMNSTNGTLVNGVPFDGLYRLRSGDAILIGRTELRLLIAQ